MDQATKSFDYDASRVGGNPYRTIFFVPVPGLQLDRDDVDFNGLYADSNVTEPDREGPVEALEALPCCARDKEDNLYGDSPRYWRTLYKKTDNDTQDRSGRRRHP